MIQIPRPVIEYTDIHGYRPITTLLFSFFHGHGVATAKRGTILIVKYICIKNQIKFNFHIFFWYSRGESIVFTSYYLLG
jgi:hypothetical protein